MEFVSYFRVLSVAFFMGFAAAAPVGPVNMMAIRRGVTGGWRHTLVCAVGSILADLLLFSLALLGGPYLLPGLSNPTLRTVLEAICAIGLLPTGIYFFLLAVKDPRRAYRSASRRWGEVPLPSHLLGEAAKAGALTLLNPLTWLYWVGVTSSWLALAYPVLGATAPEWGVSMAGGGLITWFAALIVAVRFIPHSVGALFFRLANGILGALLIGFAMICAIALGLHFLR
jgi:threonine/homoserine/homoserine lactone efflux protein